MKIQVFCETQRLNKNSFQYYSKRKNIKDFDLGVLKNY